MDRRRSFYLAARQDDFDVTTPDAATVDSTDIPYTIAANDNVRTNDRRLSARCGALLRRMIALHALS
jgi:hypothetical protein